LVVVSSKVGRKKEEALAHLLAAVSLLYLEALFMQISGVSLVLTWPHRLCSLRVLLGGNCHCYKLSPFQAHWGRWHYTSFLRPACLFTVQVGSGPSPLSCGVFLPPPLLQAFPLLVAGQCCCSCLLCPACLFTVLWGIAPLLLFGTQETLPPFATCLFCCYCLLFSFFSFFPGWGLVCPVGYADLAQDCLWEYHILLISPCGLRLPKQSGCWCLVAAQEPSWFLCLTWSRKVIHGLEVWRSQNFASSWWFFLWGVSAGSLQDLTLGGMLSASSL
jgi:hypothetical protein